LHSPENLLILYLVIHGTNRNKKPRLGGDLL